MDIVLIPELAKEMYESMSNFKKKTTNISCRIDSNVYDILVNDAELKGISLNSLISSITKRYVSWEKYANEIGYVPLSKETVKKMFEKLDEMNIKKIAYNVGSTIPREFLMLTYGNVNFPNIINMIEINASRYGNTKHSIDNNTHLITVVHGLNHHFSLFYSTLLEAMAKDLSFNLKIVSANSNMVSCEIVENSVP